ncbi:AAA family ATPase [Streptomyces sp. NBC_01465]|uniref:AAA family ATPase n=1 Tax=Streptomyces sp. NBC_01465 TaxID=2903878 RepID=UPI002E365145|nr:AAA family ATPase [Streptomyces sp. NBC_01465]
MASSTAERVEIRLIGGFRVAVDGITVPGSRWTRSGACRLLKTLALAGAGGVGRSRLCALMWPGVPATAAAGRLRVDLHALRRVLEPELRPRAESRYVQSLPDGVLRLVAGPVRVDLWETRSAAHAATTGELERLARSLLPELLPQDVAIPFLALRREEFSGLRREAVVAYASRCRGSDRAEEAVRLLRRVLAADPLAGDVCRALLEALLALGRGLEAVRHFHAHRRAFGEAYGRAPDRVLGALFSRAVEATVPPPRPETRPGTGTEFIGRQRELALVAALSQPSVPRVIALGGEPGIGLSRTLEEATRRLRARGVTVLHGWHTGPEGVPYDPVLAAFDDFARLLTPEGRGELALRCPELADALPALHGSGRSAPHVWAPDAVRLLAELARHRPVAVLLDDVEAAASDARGLLRRLIRRSADTRVRFVVAERHSGGPSSLPASEPVHRLTLERLDRAQCARLVTGVDGRSLPADEIHRRSGGNPLFALELARGALDRALVLRRLRREPAGVRHLLDVLALRSDPMPYPQLILAASGQFPRSELVAAVDRSVRTGWVRTVDGPRYEIAVPAVASALAEEYGGCRRPLWPTASAMRCSDTATSGRTPG